MFDRRYDSDEESSGSERNAPTSKPIGLINKSKTDGNGTRKKLTHAQELENLKRRSQSNKWILQKLKKERSYPERASMKNINELKEMKERKQELCLNYGDNYFSRLSELSKR